MGLAHVSARSTVPLMPPTTSRPPTLRSLRLALGIAPAVAARRCGLARARYLAIERHAPDATVGEMRRVAKALDINIEAAVAAYAEGRRWARR